MRISDWSSDVCSSDLGSVMLWDRGTWAPIEGKSAKDIEKGHLHFILDGERMKGEWLLVRMKPRGNEKRENWLLRKVNEGFAGGTDALAGRQLRTFPPARTMPRHPGAEGGEQPQKGDGRSGGRGK